jgi:hypothetical protein
MQNAWGGNPKREERQKPIPHHFALTAAPLGLFHFLQHAGLTRRTLLNAVPVKMGTGSNLPVKVRRLSLGAFDLGPRLSP